MLFQNFFVMIYISSCVINLIIYDLQFLMKENYVSF